MNDLLQAGPDQQSDTTCSLVSTPRSLPFLLPVPALSLPFHLSALPSYATDLSLSFPLTYYAIAVHPLTPGTRTLPSAERDLGAIDKDLGQ